MATYVPDTMSERIRELVEEPAAFVKEGTQFLKRCTKPDRKGTWADSNRVTEFIQICRAVCTGFVLMGFIGYLVKLVHIPINNIVGDLKRKRDLVLTQL